MSSADLRLRFGTARLSTLVRWPQTAAQSLALVIGDEVSPADSLLASSIVVALAGPREAGAELAALRWLGDHAEEIGGPGQRLLVAGGARAARLAVTARDGGWPVLERQVLVRPRFSAEHPMPTELADLPPATVAGGFDDDSRWYTARLRQAGVPVQEIRR